ncbi:M20/M25/M40 family metallo-hydrolase [Boseaceae bacterium BT-24-1]|nr:M20/M25/M40 family metallo-hydrolase [Boseaceae bacterium BT-24-1]
MVAKERSCKKENLGSVAQFSTRGVTETGICTTMMTIADRARDWAIWLTRFASVTGTQGERDLPAALAERLRASLLWRGCEVWLIPAPDDVLGRSCLAVLARGKGDKALLLTGHFDTVPVDDYGELRELATDPEPLREALLRQLRSPATPAEELAKRDLESGLFLPGRGLLDMKAGLAAGLAAIEEFLQSSERLGNLLFVAVPDEEVNSVGARALATAMPQIVQERAIRLVGAINLDCIGDRGDGTLGRSVALGSVGKLLPTALVIGQPTHASHPLQGINAAAIAGAIASRLEWATELTDRPDGEPGIPPTLLSLKDSKRHYDVTTPDACFASWNILTMGRAADDVLGAFEDLIRDAVAAFARTLAERQAFATTTNSTPQDIPIFRASAVVAEASRDPSNADGLKQMARQLSCDGLSLPDQNEKLTFRAWQLAGRSGPAVVIGFGSLPYPHVEIDQSDQAQAMFAAIEVARAQTMATRDTVVGLCRHFPGISDMSFLGQADTQSLGLIAENTPAWDSGVRWSGAVIGVPTVNIGPWGRDYHTALERVETRYAFDLLPRLLLDVARARFRTITPAR